MENVSQQSILNSEASETQNKVQKGLAYNSWKRHAIDLSLSNSNSSVQTRRVKLCSDVDGKSPIGSTPIPSANISKVLFTCEATQQKDGENPEILRAPQPLDLLVSQNKKKLVADSSQTEFDFHVSPLFEDHSSPVKFAFLFGLYDFTASEDGSVHGYDLVSKSLVTKMIHPNPVRWLHATVKNTQKGALKNAKTGRQYMKHLRLITGCEDTYVRQFVFETETEISLNDKECRQAMKMYERKCSHVSTCVAANKAVAKLYVGTKEGAIFTYNPSFNSIQKTKIQSTREVVFLKICHLREKTCIVVAAKRICPVLYDCETENALLELTPRLPKTTYSCMTFTPNVFYFCDVDKNVVKYDLNKEQFWYYSLPSPAINVFIYLKRFLVFGCANGFIRLVDTNRKTTFRILDLPKLPVKTISCMKIDRGRIIGGSSDGDVVLIHLPDLELMFKHQSMSAAFC